MTTHKSNKGNVTVHHHSTPSLVEIIIVSFEDNENGEPEKIVDKLWLDYYSFAELKEVLSKISFP